MIQNIVKPGAGFGGLLSYLFEESHRPLVVGSTFPLGADPAAIAREFAQLRDLNREVMKHRATKHPVFHCSLALPYDETLTPEEWNRLGRDYLDALGYKNSPHLFVVHRDQDHLHLHIVASRIDYDGRRIPDSWEWVRGEAIVRELEVKYGLAVQPSSRRALTPEAMKRAEIELYRRTGEPSARQRIRTAVNKAAEGTQDLETLKRRLDAVGVEMRIHQQSSGRIFGVSYAIGDRAFQGRKVGKAFGLAGLKRRGIVVDQAEHEKHVRAEIARNLSDLADLNEAQIRLDAAAADPDVLPVFAASAAHPDLGARLKTHDRKIGELRDLAIADPGTAAAAAGDEIRALRARLDTAERAGESAVLSLLAKRARAYEEILLADRSDPTAGKFALLQERLAQLKTLAADRPDDVAEILAAARADLEALIEAAAADPDLQPHLDRLRRGLIEISDAADPPSAEDLEAAERIRTSAAERFASIIDSGVAGAPAALAAAAESVEQEILAASHRVVAAAAAEQAAHFRSAAAKYRRRSDDVVRSVLGDRFAAFEQLREHRPDAAAAHELHYAVVAPLHVAASSDPDEDRRAILDRAAGEAIALISAGDRDQLLETHRRILDDLRLRAFRGVDVAADLDQAAELFERAVSSQPRRDDVAAVRRAYAALKESPNSAEERRAIAERMRRSHEAKLRVLDNLPPEELRRAQPLIETRMNFFERLAEQARESSNFAVEQAAHAFALRYRTLAEKADRAERRILSDFETPNRRLLAEHLSPVEERDRHDAARIDDLVLDPIFAALEAEEDPSKREILEDVLDEAAAAREPWEDLKEMRAFHDARLGELRLALFYDPASEDLARSALREAEILDRAALKGEAFRPDAARMLREYGLRFERLAYSRELVEDREALAAKFRARCKAEADALRRDPAANWRPERRRGLDRRIRELDATARRSLEAANFPQAEAAYQAIADLREIADRADRDREAFAAPWREHLAHNHRPADERDRESAKADHAQLVRPILRALERETEEAKIAALHGLALDAADLRDPSIRAREELRAVHDARIARIRLALDMDPETAIRAAAFEAAVLARRMERFADRPEIVRELERMRVAYELIASSPELSAQRPRLAQVFRERHERDLAKWEAMPSAELRGERKNLGRIIRELDRSVDRSIRAANLPQAKAALAIKVRYMQLAAAAEAERHDYHREHLPELRSKLDELRAGFADGERVALRIHREVIVPLAKELGELEPKKKESDDADEQARPQETPAEEHSAEAAAAETSTDDEAPAPAEAVTAEDAAPAEEITASADAAPAAEEAEQEGDAEDPARQERIAVLKDLLFEAAKLRNEAHKIEIDRCAHLVGANLADFEDFESIAAAAAESAPVMPAHPDAAAVKDSSGLRARLYGRLSRAIEMRSPEAAAYAALKIHEHASRVEEIEIPGAPGIAALKERAAALYAEKLGEAIADSAPREPSPAALLIAAELRRREDPHAEILADLHSLRRQALAAHHQATIEESDPHHYALDALIDRYRGRIAEYEDLRGADLYSGDVHLSAMADRRALVGVDIGLRKMLAVDVEEQAAVYAQFREQVAAQIATLEDLLKEPPTVKPAAEVIRDAEQLAENMPEDVDAAIRTATAHLYDLSRIKQTPEAGEVALRLLRSREHLIEVRIGSALALVDNLRDQIALEKDAEKKIDIARQVYAHAKALEQIHRLLEAAKPHEPVDPAKPEHSEERPAEEEDAADEETLINAIHQLYRIEAYALKSVPDDAEGIEQMLAYRHANAVWSGYENLMPEDWERMEYRRRANFRMRSALSVLTRLSASAYDINNDALLFRARTYPIVYARPMLDFGVNRLRAIRIDVRPAERTPEALQAAIDSKRIALMRDIRTLSRQLPAATVRQLAREIAPELFVLARAVLKPGIQNAVAAVRETVRLMT